MCLRLILFNSIFYAIYRFVCFRHSPSSLYDCFAVYLVIFDSLCNTLLVKKVVTLQTSHSPHRYLCHRQIIIHEMCVHDLNQTNFSLSATGTILGKFVWALVRLWWSQHVTPRVRRAPMAPRNYIAIANTHTHRFRYILFKMEVKRKSTSPLPVRGLPGPHQGAPSRVHLVSGYGHCHEIMTSAFVWGSANQGIWKFVEFWKLLLLSNKLNILHS